MAGVFVSLVLDAVHDLEAGVKLTLVALADRANQGRGGESWPSIADLATRAHRSERQVRYDLREIESKGWTIRLGTGEGGRGKATLYELQIAKMFAALPEKLAAQYRKELGDKPGNRLPPFPVDNSKETRQSAHKRGQSATVKGAISDMERGQPIAPEPEVEPLRTEVQPARAPATTIKRSVQTLVNKLTTSNAQNLDHKPHLTREEQLAYVREQTKLAEARKRN